LTVVQILAAFLEQEETSEARQEAVKALQRTVDNLREDEDARKMAEIAKDADRKAGV